VLALVRIIKNKNIMKQIDFINRKIDALWKKSPKNANEAHFRAEEITRLEKLRDSKSSLEAKL